MNAMATIADALLDKYGRQGPRYTSYPPAPAWSEGIGATDLAARLAEIGREPAPPADGLADAELYVHIPFCARLCTFCGCHTFITRERDPVVRWLATLEREADAVARAAGRRLSIGGLHLGGGTPTHLDLEQLAQLLDLLEARFDFAACRERGLEVHPRVTSVAQLDLLRARGFDRLSMGVQDLTPEVQAAIHRDQTADETAALAAHARATGWRSLNVDLVYGLPRQTLAGFARTIEQVLAMGVDRLAVYGYAHVPWLKRQQGAFTESALPDPRLRRDLLELARARLADAGFESIGFDHFARPTDRLFTARAAGSLTRTFMGFTVRHARNLIGLGPSAIGELGPLYAQNEPALAAWEQAVAARGLATRRGWRLSADEALRRDVIRALLCELAVDGAAIGARHGVDFRDHFARELAALREMVTDGLLVVAGARLELTAVGRHLARNVAMAFDPAQHEAGGVKRYSATV
ncbi:MAG: oxygen-independent coproporphyrinogen III oxidase [Planctomycetes bacterium]|nr:oxygen-independent coproporphyrinogen III oxidase [Planctomycetota bacterium]